MKIDIKITDDGGHIHHKQFIVNNKKSRATIQQYKNAKSSRKKPTIVDHILELIAEKYFDHYKTMTDLRLELEKRSYKFKSRDLSKPIINLIKQKKLRREKNNEGKTKWVYKKY